MKQFLEIMSNISTNNEEVEGFSSMMQSIESVESITDIYADGWIERLCPNKYENLCFDSSRNQSQHGITAISTIAKGIAQDIVATDIVDIMCIYDAYQEYINGRYDLLFKVMGNELSTQQINRIMNEFEQYNSILFSEIPETTLRRIKENLLYCG